MRPVTRGASIILSGLFLGGCLAPMTAREAQGIAGERLAKYCGNRCGAYTFSKSQKINKRWLVDYDAPRHKFTVTVENNGSASVDVWNK